MKMCLCRRGEQSRGWSDIFTYILDVLLDGLLSDDLRLVCFRHSASYIVLYGEVLVENIDTGELEIADSVKKKTPSLLAAP